MEYDLDCLEFELSELLNFDLTTLGTSDDLHNFARKLKNVFASFVLSNMHLVQRLTPFSISKALNIRKFRIKLNSEVKEVVSLINGLIANIDDDDL